MARWIYGLIGFVSLSGACSDNGGDRGLIEADAAKPGPAVAGGGDDASANTTGTDSATTVPPSTNTGGTTTTGRAPGSTGGSNFQDPEPCEELVVKSDRTIPDMLIVLDRSQSMSTISGDPMGGGAMPPAGGIDRWAASVDAIKTVVSELENDVRFGLMTFPTGDDLLACGPGTLNEPLALQNAGPIGATLDTMTVAGRTPTSSTLAAAAQVLAANPRTTDEGFPLPQYIMLVTDGDPNCVDTGRGALGMPDPMAQLASIQEIEKLAANMAFTYVIGVDTLNTPFAPVLDQMAVAGMTGDTAHRSVTGGDELLDTFRQIAGSAASCSFVLAQDVEEARVEITVDGVAAKYGTDWDLRDDMRTVDLLGSACDALQVGAVIDATVRCELVNVM